MAPVRRRTLPVDRGGASTLSRGQGTTAEPGGRCCVHVRTRLRRHILLREERAQAVVEMAVVTPVLIIVALIVYNVMLFTAASARFDRIAPDIVIAHGVSPSGDAVGDVGASAATVASALEEAMASYPVSVEVEASGGGEEADTIFSLVGVPCTYHCVMRLHPWPSGLSIAGVSLGAPGTLDHERAVTVDPWRSGVVV